MAASLDDLQAALVNADKAGDVSAAQALADEINRVRGVETVTAKPKASPSAFTESPSGAALSSRGSFGIGKHGDTMQTIRHARDQAVYDFGGRVTDLTGSPGAGSLANAAADVVTDPLTYVGGMAGKVAKPLAEKGGERLMQIALKPNKAARDSGDAIKAVRTLLEEGANVSEGGAAKLTDKINTLDDQLSVAIADSTAKLKNTDLLKSLQDVIKQYRDGTLGEKAVSKINDVAETLLRHPAFDEAGEITVQAAQKMKRQNYREFGDKAFGSGLRPQAERDALKAVTRDIKEGIENSASTGSDLAGVPSPAGAINAQMSPLIRARDLVQDRVLAAGNNNLFGISLLNPKTMLLSLMDRSPLATSAAARFAHNVAAPAMPVAGTVGGGILALSSPENGQGILAKRTAWMGDGAK